MPIKNGPNVAPLAVGLGLLDAVAEKTGTKQPGPELSAAINNIRDDVEARVEPVVGEVVAWSLQRFGLADVQLDEDHPFSDASLSGALGSVLGVEVGSVKDREQLKDAFRRAVTAQAAQKVGVQFTDVFDREALRHDVLVACGAKIGELVPGLVLNDLTNRQQTIDDVSAFGLNQLSEYLGVDFGDNLKNAAAIREAVIAWAMPKVVQVVEQEQAAGTTYTGKLLMDRRSVQLREAQRRFRAKWGNLRKYNGVKNG